MAKISCQGPPTSSTAAKLCSLFSFPWTLLILKGGSYRGAVGAIYLPTSSESHVWDFCLVMTGFVDNVPITSEDFRWFSEDFWRMPAMSKDVWVIFELFRSHLKGNNFSVLRYKWDTKSALSTLMNNYRNNVGIELKFGYYNMSSILEPKISLVGGFPRKKWIPFINMYKCLPAY